MKQAGFTPRCVACAYELTGLPDGRCPECGGVFTHAEIHAAWLEGQRVDRGGLYRACGVAGLVFAYFLSLLTVTNPPRRADEVDTLLLLIWFLAFCWGAAWRRALWARPQGLVFLCIPTLASVWMFALRFDERHQGMASLTSLVGVAALGIAAWYGPRIVGVVVGLVVSVILGIAGMRSSAAGLDAVRAGNYWTTFRDPRMGQVYDQYPLNVVEAMRFGEVAVFVSVIGVVVIVAYAIGRRREIWAEWGRER